MYRYGAGAKYVPEHGRGELRRGNPGNSGRPPQEVKDKWLELASAQAYEYALECLEDPEKTPQERIAAMNAAVKQLGVTVQLDSANVPQALARVLARHGVAPDLIEAYATDLAKELNLKGA